MCRKNTAVCKPCLETDQETTDRFKKILNVLFFVSLLLLYSGLFKEKKLIAFAANTFADF